MQYWAVGVVLNGVTDCKANVSLVRELNGEDILRAVELDDDNMSDTQRGKVQMWIEDIFSILTSYGDHFIYRMF